MLSFWAGGISSFPPCAREYRLLRRLTNTKWCRKDIPPNSNAICAPSSLALLLSDAKFGSSGSTISKWLGFHSSNSSTSSSNRRSTRYTWPQSMPTATNPNIRRKGALRNMSTQRIFNIALSGRACLRLSHAFSKIYVCGHICSEDVQGPEKRFFPLGFWLRSSYCLALQSPTLLYGVYKKVIELWSALPRSMFNLQKQLFPDQNDQAFSVEYRCFYKIWKKWANTKSNKNSRLKTHISIVGKSVKIYETYFHLGIKIDKLYLSSQIYESYKLS